MDLTFLTPRSGLVALLVLVPLLAFLRTNRYGRRVRAAIGLVEPRRRSLLLAGVALVLTAGFLGAAAMQPVVSTDETRRLRTDAEVFVAFDVSRSMLASEAAGEPSRLARAKAEALKLRDAIPDVRFGAASVTDRALPHLFPTGDEDVFRATLEKAIGIERPPPVHSLVRRVTSLESLGAVATQSFFSPESARRVLVVFTDGETLPGTRARLGPLFQRPPGISTVFVHVWDRDERIYIRKSPEIGYRADPASRETLDRIAEGIGGRVVSENELSKAKREVSRLVGTGPTVAEGEKRRDIQLAPPLAAAAFLPLALLLWRRDR